MDDSATVSERNRAADRNQFGTFAGVFTPSILTILGVIMFLRAGYVVGEGGIGAAALILVLSTAITFLTSLSIGAIATNTPVKGGGAYYLISRALGPQFGGAIGLALFLAQALSVPFYVLSFTEALVQTVPALKPLALPLALGTLTVLFIVNLVGAGWAIRAQYLVMTVLGLAIAAFLGGAALRFDPALFSANWEPLYSARGITFWTLFAIYFPAVTGILSGVNMSGDLRDPARSLVRGTLAAVAAGFAIYLAQIVLCGGSQTRDQLVQAPYRTLLEHALFGAGVLVLAGVCAATLSSALGSLLGAPRVLQAFARDRILPGAGVFAHGAKHGDEPRRALVLTYLLSLGVVALAGGGESLAAFDVVASVITMFFLCTYGIINLAAFVELFGGNPSFRPRFRLCHWSLALAGAAGCFGAMFQIDFAAAAVSVVLIAGLYAMVSRRLFHAEFGDARRGFVYTLVARNLYRLQQMRPDPKNWRPTLLVLSGNPQTRLTLVRYGAWLEAHRGIVTVAELLLGDSAALLARRDDVQREMAAALAEHGLSAIPEVIVTASLDEGIRMLVQAHSIGPIKPNTVLVGWPRDPDRVGPFARHLRDIDALGKSLLCVVDRGVPPIAARARTIDVWWHGPQHTSLLLLLAHLLRLNWEWRQARIRLIGAVDGEGGWAADPDRMRELAAAARIDAEVLPVRGGADAMRVRSVRADVVLMHLLIPLEDEAHAFFAGMEAVLKDLPTTLLVHSSGEADALA